MEIIGGTKTRPSFGCDLAVRKGYPLYCTYNDPEKIAAFGPAGYTCHGGSMTCWPLPTLWWIVHLVKSGQPTKKHTSRPV